MFLIGYESVFEQEYGAMTAEQNEVEQQESRQVQAPAVQAQAESASYQSGHYPLETINACALMSSPID